VTLPRPILSDMPSTGPLVDPFGRVHTYLRVSVTDRCNYRCVYCMPADGLDWMPREDILTYEEIARIVGAVRRMGITRVRLTGGEPTVRKDIVTLVEKLGALGLDDLAMTTNGHLFGRKAQAFAKAGLKRVNISLDAIDPAKFAAITRGGDVRRVLEAIEQARDAGLVPVKINAVVVAGENEDDVERLITHFAPHAADTIVRFIEVMPFEADARRSVPSRVLRERLSKRFTLTPETHVKGVGPSKYWRIEETGQIVGFISPITEHFCEACNRLRLMADGHLRTCLSRDKTPSLRDLVRDGIDDEGLENAIRAMVWGKVAGHEAHLVDGFRAFEGVMTRIGG